MPAIAPLLLAFVALVWFPVEGNAQEVAQRGYSTEPLREPIFDRARVDVETLRIDTWLNSNYKTLSARDMKGPQEHLYYLIDSRVKDIFATSQKILPPKHDPILEILFSWSERLGAYGGTLVYNRLRSPRSGEMHPLLKLPAGISIALVEDLLSVTSAEGRWSVMVPYYFMIRNVADSNTRNGLRTQLVGFSTGTAKDIYEHSQASLLLVFSPGADATEFANFWRGNLRIADARTQKDVGVRGLRAQYHFEPKSKLHTEFVSWSSKQGPFGVAYLGNDGTYQWNRQHFIDFLKAIRFE